jgi:hypothetical protein
MTSRIEMLDEIKKRKLLLVEQWCCNCVWEKRVRVLRAFPCNPKVRCQELLKTLHAAMRWGLLKISD